jgi:hypothetical protein
MQSVITLNVKLCLPFSVINMKLCLRITQRNRTDHSTGLKRMVNRRLTPANEKK